MARKAAALYNLSLDEAMRLSPDQVAFMEDYARRQAEEMFDASPELQKELQDRLSPVTRQIRSTLGSESAPVGPPPGTGEPRGSWG